jgi:hypothetical protein
MSFNPIKNIVAGPHATQKWQDLRIRSQGIPGFNEVRLKPGSLEYLTVSGRPLVASGRYGKGRTVAFTGFTPAYVQPKPRFTGEEPIKFLVDQRLRDDPATEPYFELFTMLLSETSGQTPGVESEAVLVSRRESLFEILKKLPPAILSVPERLLVRTSGKEQRLSLTLLNGQNYARLVRVRAEWDEGEPDVVLYSDNYFDLLPGESKSVQVEFHSIEEHPGTADGRLLIEGTNVTKAEVPIAPR